MTCFVGLTLCFAETPMMGTWKLNEAKSKFSSRSPKASPWSMRPHGDNMKCTIDGVDGKGKPFHNVWVGKFDGKDYPLTGDPAATHGRTRRSTTTPWP